MQLREACEQTYQQMMTELNHCRRFNFIDSARIAFCFKIAMDYWSKLIVFVNKHMFINEEEEIWFFKMTKPRHTALIEYYTMVYHAELLKSCMGENELQQFWEKENDKMKNFYAEHSGFCRYYKNGEVTNDRNYFLRVHPKVARQYSNKLYDNDDVMVCLYGRVATTLIAYDMYGVYLLQQVKSGVSAT